jgi:hypothetical protein
LFGSRLRSTALSSLCPLRRGCLSIGFGI